jgi:gamma-glutamylcyclotransferase (GGCT)/AIG2-like uncharacterized protein YtfP
VEYLFVYGSLKSTQPANEGTDLMKSSNLIGDATVPGRLYDFGDFSGAVIDVQSRDQIHGEIFQLPDPAAENLKALDAYEEFDPSNPQQSLFVRRTISAMLSDGRRLNCWIYVYNREPGAARQILGGMFAE